MRSDDLHSNYHLASQKFLGETFWVAEPIQRITNDERATVSQYHFACDPVPEGFHRHTLPRPGSRVDRCHGRHTVKCTDVRVSKYGAGRMFTVFLTLKRGVA
ncbi:hypothetical protein [Acinetobacter shaoyimingii]|uniref:hypothetical protein n=1 Tax=Acinetobacter shaoyimingii TaxID=2715164 RepID=UPI001D0EDFAB|nr:hypothetical protein [Acinetobacter shaoyimingii]